jgi:predicted acetyltransferase
MLFLLDGSLRCGGEQTRSGYIYAACTAPEHRGKGYMSALLNGADDIARRQGKEFLCLVPSEQSLFEYYARFGYLSSFKTKKIVLSRFVLEQIADTLQSVTDPSPKDWRN